MRPGSWLRSVLCLGLLCSSMVSVSVCAQTQGALDAQVYESGLHLFQRGDYQQAMTEFKRFALLFPDHPRYPSAALLIGMALHEARAYDEALDYFQRWRLDDDPTDATRVAVFKRGELLFIQGRYRLALAPWQEFLERYPEGPLVTHTKYLLGLSWALDGQLDQARQVFATLPLQDALGQQALTIQETLRLTPPPVPKSPLTASVLSGILPGAGHLYAGKPWQALTAFLLNGAFLTGAVYALHDRLYVTGAILLFFETGWYLGGISSAMEATRAANRTEQQAWAEHLRAVYAPPVLTLPALQAPALGLRLTF